MKKGFVFILIVFLILSCGMHSQPEAEKRLRRYFQLSDKVNLSSQPCALLAKIPVGTAEKEVYEFLAKTQIGKDGLSSYYPATDTPVIVCRVEYDANVPAPNGVAVSFGAFFYLDRERKVNGAKIERWLTGP